MVWKWNRTFWITPTAVYKRSPFWTQQIDLLTSEWLHSSVGSGMEQASQGSWVWIPLKTPDKFQVHIQGNRWDCPASTRITSSINRLSVSIFSFAGSELEDEVPSKWIRIWNGYQKTFLYYSHFHQIRLKNKGTSSWTRWYQCKRKYFTRCWVLYS